MGDVFNNIIKQVLYACELTIKTKKPIYEIVVWTQNKLNTSHITLSNIACKYFKLNFTDVHGLSRLFALFFFQTFFFFLAEHSTHLCTHTTVRFLFIDFGQHDEWNFSHTHLNEIRYIFRLAVCVCISDETLRNYTFHRRTQYKRKKVIKTKILPNELE